MNIKKLADEIRRLDTPPTDAVEFGQWIEAGAHLDFLRRNALANEFIVYGSGEYTFIHTMVVSNDRLSPIDEDDLLRWSCNPYRSASSYVYGSGRSDVWIERGSTSNGAAALKGATNLIFGRTFEGWTGSDRNYYELNQEYAHLTGIHWRPEQKAYCRFNDNGDLDPLVSITSRDDKQEDVALGSFRWEPLEEYLAASNSSLVRMFEFMLLDRTAFSAWPDGPEEVIRESAQLFYRRKINPGHASYTRGVQLVRPRRSAAAIFGRMSGGWVGEGEDDDKQYVEFIAHDWRNHREIKISTDPAQTTNYFAATGNSLPFELSPAFFRPEVLLKYKGDRDKYKVGEREVSCRSAWHLKAIDVNEAGQVHAYICYLRNLPYGEQLHWASFNEAPKSGISKRAIINDFEGNFTFFWEPLPEVLAVARRWNEKSVPWWTLRNRDLLERVNTPITPSRDEWGDAFMDLSKLIVEGFETRVIRSKLDDLGIAYDAKEQSVALLERLLTNAQASSEPARLSGLRTVQLIRSKVRGHAGNHDAEQLAHEALLNHETFSGHFKHTCTIVAGELKEVEALFSPART